MTNDILTPKKICFFCAAGIKTIDYKDAQTLKKFISSYAKILPRRKTGLCAKHQRKLAKAVKRARITAFLPFVTK